jgi:RimJ/RimL family protein N-acetyltransferase
MPNPTFPLRTERLVLRFFTDDDLDAYHDMQSREEVVRYLYWGPQSREEASERLERMKHLTSLDSERAAIRLAVVLPESGVLVGDVSLWRTSEEHAQGEIGFVIHPDHQGHGYAAEACAVLLEMGFGQLGLHRVIGRADSRNIGSVRLMERLGMRREALFRENEFVKGEWSDEVWYAILASEWQPRA